jgi:hypothetical protein
MLALILRHPLYGFRNQRRCLTISSVSVVGNALRLRNTKL